MDKKQKPKSKPKTKKKSLTKSKKASSKKLNAESSKTKVKKTTRYNKIQKILSRYLRENNIKVGKEFNKIAGALNRKTKDTPLKYVEQNINALYTEHFKKDVVEPFPNEFPFYMLNQVVTTATFDNVEITVSFNDGLMEADIKGDSAKVVEEFRASGLYSHLRKYYDASPQAMFMLKSSGKNKVEYAIETFQAPTKPVDKPKTAPVSQKKEEVVAPYSASEVIAIEREKQKTMKEVQKLLKQGFTKDEIFRLLGK